MSKTFETISCQFICLKSTAFHHHFFEISPKINSPPQLQSRNLGVWISERTAFPPAAAQAPARRLRRRPPPPGERSTGAFQGLRWCVFSSRYAHFFSTAVDTPPKVAQFDLLIWAEEAFARNTGLMLSPGYSYILLCRQDGAFSCHGADVVSLYGRPWTLDPT